MTELDPTLAAAIERAWDASATIRARYDLGGKSSFVALCGRIADGKMRPINSDDPTEQSLMATLARHGEAAKAARH